VTTPCRVCLQPTRIEWHSAFRFERCRHCGYGLISGNDSDSRDYWGAAVDANPGHYFIESRQAYFEAVLDFLADVTRGRRLVDVGGGVGFFAQLALARGWDAVSLDTSATATDLAAARLGHDRALRSLPEEALGAFDAATMWCVVAHTHEPGRLAELAAQALRPGGRLFLTTPNFTFQIPYAAARKLVGRTLDFVADDHYGHFTARAAQLLLERAGFDEVRFHFMGITEACVAAGDSRLPALVAAKRLWNRLAFLASSLHLPLLTSDLQVSARRA
jgi:SAM-dependent methyltransferase